MSLCHYLSPQYITLSLAGDTKEALLKTATAFLAQSHDLGDPAALFSLIWEREQSASTFLPMGVAVPHARIAGIDDIKMVLCLIPAGFPNPDDPEMPPTHVICTFVSPTKETAFTAHLKLLSQIAALFEDPAFIDQLLMCKNSEAAFTLIQHHERAIANVT